MTFSSVSFLCLFLPAVFGLYHILPGTRAKNALLIAASLLFYAWGEPVYILLMILSVLVNWLAGRWIGSARKGARLPMVLAVVFNLALLGVFKYSGFLMETLGAVTGLALPVPRISLPIGISFFTFQAMSYVLDVYWNPGQMQKSFWRLLLYISFFPQLIAGPIVRYHDIEGQLSSRTVTADETAAGLRRFLAGLAKKMLLANAMAVAADGIFGMDLSILSAPAAWIGALAYLFQIYFDFSGYSDMAIGLSRMFGFTFPENFRYPYAALGIKDFWRRWHISLSGWFWDYLYIPLGGNRKGKVRTWLNQLIVFFCTGLWHGANVTFIVWGLFHGALLIAESSGLLNVRKWRFKGLAHVYTLLMVTVGFVIFRADTMGDAWLYLKAMFTSWSVGGVTLRQAVGYLTPYFLLLTAAAALACTPVWPRLQEAARRRAETGGGDGLARAVRAGSYALSGAALLLCLFALATDSYNPFIYFRF